MLCLSTRNISWIQITFPLFMLYTQCSVFIKAVLCWAWCMFIQGFVLHRIPSTCWFPDITTYILKFSKIGEGRGKKCNTFSWVFGDASAFSLKTEHEVASVRSLHGTQIWPTGVITYPFTLYKINWEIMLLLVQFLYETTRYQLRTARWYD